jgi:DinB superfamily
VVPEAVHSVPLRRVSATPYDVSRITPRRTFVRGAFTRPRRRDSLPDAAASADAPSRSHGRAGPVLLWGIMDFDLPAGIAVLERTPQALRALLSGLPASWTDGTEGPETWSPYVIIGHLNHGERTDWIPRARIILAQGPHRRFTPYDRFAQFQESRGKSLEDLLGEFAQLRADNLATLAGWQLTDASLALEGEHPEFGAVTLRQLLATWVAHDLGHVAQVSRVMAKQYRDAVGPWRAYLPVMDR